MSVSMETPLWLLVEGIKVGGFTYSFALQNSNNDDLEVMLNKCFKHKKHYS